MARQRRPPIATKGKRPSSRGYRLRESETLAEGPILRMRRERIRLPNGRETQQDVLDIPPVVAVLPIVPNGDGSHSVVLVEQFRNPSRRYIFEIPAGLVEAGESLEDCARRELEEETGYRPGRLEHLASLLSLPGSSAHRFHIFLADELAPGRQRLDPVECLHVRHVAYEPLVASLIRDPPGSSLVVDMKTHLALLHSWLLFSHRRGAFGSDVTRPSQSTRRRPGKRA